MKGTVIALVTAAALFMLVSPTIASEAICSTVGQASGNLSGASQGVVSGAVGQNCGNSAGTSPVVAAPEPLGALAVGLGLLGARLLRRR